MEIARLWERFVRTLLQPQAHTSRGGGPTSARSSREAVANRWLKISVIGLFLPSGGFAQVPLTNTWNPAVSVGDWFIAIPEIWLGGVCGVSPPQFYPDNNGNCSYLVQIPSGKVNFSLSATVNTLDIGLDGELEITVGSLIALIETSNNGTLKVALGSLIAGANFLNTGTVQLAGGSITAGVFENIGESSGLVAPARFDVAAGAITGTSFYNNEHAEIRIDGPVTWGIPVLDNDGLMLLDTDAASLLVTAGGTEIFGSGRLKLDAPAARVVSGHLGNFGSHTILGQGELVIASLDNSGNILANVAGGTLELATPVLDNSGQLGATLGSRLKIGADDFTNSGLSLANNSGEIDIDIEGGDIRNSGIFRAETLAVITIDDAVIDGAGGRFEAATEGVINLNDNQVFGGAFDSDAMSKITNTGVNRLSGVSVNGLFEVQALATTFLIDSVENTTGDLRVLSTGTFRSNVVTIAGGTISGDGGYEVDSGQTNFDAAGGMTWNDVVIDINPRGRLKLNGIIENNATLRLEDTNPVVVDLQGHANSLVRIDGTVTLDGTGDIVFATANFNEFEPEDAASLLVLGAGQTVRPETATAYGRFVVNMDNHGLIDARGGAIDINNAFTVNDGELAASEGGLLQILNVAGTTDNRGGLIASGSGSRIELRGRLRGGELDGPGVVTLHNPATFSDNVTLRPAADVAVHTFGDLTLVGNHTNNGTLRLADNPNPIAGDDADVRVEGEVTLTGTGRLLFDSPGQNFLFPIDASSRLIIDTEQTLGASAGARGIVDDLAITIRGDIDSAGIIEFNRTSLLNMGTVRARGPGESIRLGQFGRTEIDNAAGVIAVDTGSEIRAPDARIFGGVLNGGGMLSAGQTRVEDLTIAAGATLNSGPISTLEMFGTFVNDGVIRQGGSGTHSMKSLVHLDGAVVVNGSGVWRVDTVYENFVISLPGSAAPASLTLGPLQTLDVVPGARSYMENFDLVVQGEVQSSGQFDTASMSWTNHGTIRALTPSAIQFGTFGPVSLDNAAGHIDIVPGASILATNVTIAGGTIGGGGQLTAGSQARLENVTVNPGTTISAGPISTVQLFGTLVNDGVFRQGGSGTHSFKSLVHLDGPVVLNGDGVWRVDTVHENFIDTIPGAALPGSLTIGPMQTFDVVAGARSYLQGFDLIIDGEVRSAGVLETASMNWINRGTIRTLTTNAITLGLFGPTPVDNSGGRIIIDTGTSLFAPNSVITGGEVSGGGNFNVGSNTTLEGNIAFDGTRIALGGTDNLTIRDTLISNARITMAGAGTHSQKALITIDGDVTFTGGGVLQALTNQENFVLGGSGAHLTFAEDFAIDVTSGSRLYTQIPIVSHGRVETHGLMQLFGAAPLTTSDTTLITGTGEIQLAGNALTSSGTIAPGFGPSGLTIRANVTTDPTSVLDIEIAGTDKFTGYDVLTSYSLEAGGTLQVSLLGSFAPQIDDVFDIYDGVIYSLFAALELPALLPGRVWDTSDLYSAGSLRVVSAPVPVPPSVGLLLGGLLLLKRRLVWRP